MDLRTASREARLAFSIRCQRSATWVACGNALAAGFAIAAASIPRDHDDRLVASEPCLGGRRRAIRQKRHRPAPCQVADDRSVAVIAAPRKIVVADHHKRFLGNPRSAADNAKQGIVADRQHQPLRKAGGRSTAKSKAERMHDPFNLKTEEVAKLKDLELPASGRLPEVDVIGLDPGKIVEPRPVGDPQENLTTFGLWLSKPRWQQARGTH